jgi:hypothetical protein
MLRTIDRLNDAPFRYIQAIELCISDRNKPLLLNSSVEFIPYLVDALLLVRNLTRARSLVT